MPYTKSPTSYLGVKSRNPPNMFIKYRRPTINDIEPFNMGDFWVIPTQLPPLPTEEVWELVGMQQNQASWVQLNSADSAVYLNHQLLVGAGTSTINQIPLGNAGQPLLSGGASADPSWGSFVAYAPIVGGTTSTGALQSVATSGSIGQVLTSQGAALPIWADPGFEKINVQTFTTSGTYTPTAGMLYCIVEALGGGGGGGGSQTVSTFSYIISGGGGAGGYCRSVLTAADIGASQTVTIGIGGAGGAGGGTTTGATGGDTTFGSILTANGGVGAAGGSGFVTTGGGTGGAASGGDINVYGQAGFVGAIGGGGSGQFWGITPLGGNSQYGSSGAGAPSYVGSASVALTDGASGIGYGSGGCGTLNFYGSGGSGTKNTTGGSGASGLVIITEFITA